MYIFLNKYLLFKIMISPTCYLINFSVDASGSKPVVTLTQPEATPPDVAQSISSMITSISASIQENKLNIQTQLTTLSQTLEATVSAFSTEFHDEISTDYTNKVNEIKTSISAATASITFPTSFTPGAHSKILTLLRKLNSKYEYNMTNIPMKNSSKKPMNRNNMTHSTSISRDTECSSLNKLNTDVSTISSQLSSLYQNDEMLSNALIDIVSKLTKRNTILSKSTIFNPQSTSSSSSNISQVETTISAYQASIDSLKTSIQESGYTLPGYATTALTQLETSIESGDKTRLTALLNTFKSGLSDEEKSKLSVEIDEVQGNILLASANFKTSKPVNTRRTRNFNSTSETTSTTNNAIDNTISILTKKRTEESKIYSEKIANGETSQEIIDEFTTKLSNINNEIAKLEAQKTTNSIPFGNSSRGLPRVMKQVGTTIGKSRIGDYIKFFVNANKVPKTLSYLDQKAINADVLSLSLIKQRIKDNHPLKTSGVLSALTVSTTSSGNDITVNYNLTINDVPSAGSFSLYSECLSYIGYQMISNTNKLSLETKTKLINDYGITPTSTTIQTEVWNAYLVFVFSYLSIISYCLLNKTNTLGITLPDTLSFNIVDFLSVKLINNLSGIVIPQSGNKSSKDTKNILKLATVGMFSYYFYGTTNLETLGESLANKIESSSFSQIFGESD